MSVNEEQREPAEGTVPATPYAELGAMGSAFAALAPLDSAARDRALMWLNASLRWNRNEEVEPF